MHHLLPPLLSELHGKTLKHWRLPCGEHTRAEREGRRGTFCILTFPKASHLCLYSIMEGLFPYLLPACMPLENWGGGEKPAWAGNNMVVEEEGGLPSSSPKLTLLLHSNRKESLLWKRLSYFFFQRPPLEEEEGGLPSLALWRRNKEDMEAEEGGKKKETA